MGFSAEAKVGLVAILALVILAYMIVTLGHFGLHKQGYYLEAVFAHVDGLQAGNTVRYAGVEVGRVIAVTPAPDGVLVKMQLAQGVQVQNAARFLIGSTGLLGEKYVEILPSAQPGGVPLAPGSTVKGEDPQRLDELFARADRVMAEIERLVASLNEVISNDTAKTALKQSIRNLETVTAHLEQFSASLARTAVNNEADIRAIVVNMRAVSVNLRDTATQVNNFVNQVAADGQTAAELRATVQSLKRASGNLETMTAKMEKTVTDPKTLTALQETIRNASEASAKANQMLTRLQAVETEGRFELLHNGADQFASNAAFRIRINPREFYVIGVNDIGNAGTLDLQYGKSSSQVAQRIGVMDGKAGIGWDARLGTAGQLSLDVIDPNDVRLKMRGEYRLTGDHYLLLQTNDLLNAAQENTYIGVRTSF